MIWFIITLTYIISWVLTFISIKIEHYDEILDNLKNGHLAWLIFPFVNLIASLVFLIISIKNWFAGSDDIIDRFVDWLFIKKDKE